MASSSTKGFPTFFKVIMGSTSDTTLIIPPEFIRRFGHNLPNPVFLKLPNVKKLTEVELNQVNGQILMSRGWPEFKQRLSLGYGHFLLFEFDCDSRLFNVRIFDTSAVEITYPYSEDFPNKRKVKVDNREHVIEISDDDDYPAPKKSLRTTGNLSSANNNNYKGPVLKETSSAYQKAEAFASRDLDPIKTPFVIRLMQKSYVSGTFSLKLQVSFGRQSFARTGANSVTMITTNGKQRSARCLMNCTCLHLSAGWSDFVKENELKVGDVCIFQVARKSFKHQQPALWNVVIFQA